MLIKDIHYDFKKKLNKVDSQQNRNLLVPEIDWVLNEAKEIYIKNQITQSAPSTAGIGVNLRNIRTLITDLNEIEVVDGVLPLPENHFYFLRGSATMTKGNCTGYKGKIHIRQHDDDFENSPFDRSSFEWRYINGLFNEDGIQLIDDGTFSIDTAEITYVRKSAYMHNAGDFEGGTYSLPSGKTFVGTVECDLPDYTHREIVDLAVLITTGELQIPDYQAKLNKIKLTN